MTESEKCIVSDKILKSIELQKALIRRNLISTDAGIHHIQGYMSALCDTELLTEDARSAIVEQFCKDVL